MVQSHGGFQQSPFADGLGPRTFHHSATHEEALARLHFLAEYRRRLGLLLGETGSGKSLLLRRFADQLRRGRSQVARVNLLGAGAQEVLWSLAAELTINPPPSAGTFELWRDVIDRITENRYQQITTVLLLDDVDQAPRETLSLVTRLIQHHRCASAPLTVVMAATYDGSSRLGARLLDLVELRIDLDHWDQADTSEYLQRMLSQADCERTVFHERAAERLHELSGGLPRRVIQLAEWALLAGAGQELEEIDVQTVEAVFQELGVMDVPPPRTETADAATELESRL